MNICMIAKIRPSTFSERIAWTRGYSMIVRAKIKLLGQKHL